MYRKFAAMVMLVAFVVMTASANVIFDTLPRDDGANLASDCGQTWMTGILGVTNNLETIEVATRVSGAGGGSVYLAVYENDAASGSASSWIKGSLVAVSSNTRNMSTSGITNTFNFGGGAVLSDNARYLYTFVDASTNGVAMSIGVRLNAGDSEQSVYTAGGIAFSGDHSIASRIATAPSVPMALQGSTMLQTTSAIPRFGIHGVAALEITSAGNLPTNTITGLTYNLNDTTNPSDIEEVRLYDSKGSSVFDVNTADLLATQAPPVGPTGTFSINRLITYQTQYLWVAVKLSGTSSDGDLIDAEILDFTLTGPDAGAHIPATTAPPEYLAVDINKLYSVVVRKQGDDGVHTYRIPGLATSTAGTLLAVFDVRHTSIYDLPRDIDVGFMRSTDGGLSWEPMQVIMDYDKTVPGSQGNGVSDPCIFVDRVTGRIWCAALWSKGDNASNGSGPGLTEDETGQLVLCHSDDDGLTWTAPVSITAEVKDPAWNLYFDGPGKGICTRDGVLVFPSQFKDSGGVSHSAFIYSTDHGVSWNNAPAAIPSGNPWSSESQIVELDSGDLLLTMRNGDNSKSRVWCVYSWDHGTQTIADGTWGTPWFDQNDPRCQASVQRYSSVLDGDPWSGLLFSNPDNTSTRVDMTIRLSIDEGQSWPYKRKIDDLQASYSCMTMLPGGDIGILYETGETYAAARLEFARFPVAWLVGDTDTDGDGTSDFEEYATRAAAQTLTGQRTNAPAAMIPFPRDLVWESVDSDASRVAIVRPTGSGDILLHAEHVLTNALAEAGAVINPPVGTETCTITLTNGPVASLSGSDEAYELVATSNSVTITAPTDAGLLYGVQTLGQLLVGPTSSPQIAGCSIIDWPAFGVRGFMHDVGRNFQSVDLLKTQVDTFAKYKLNTFHLHLTEYTAWRIESELYTNLTDAAHHWPTRDPGQFYSKAELLDLAEYCGERNITFIPEIDLPGHTEAFRSAMGITMSDPLAVEIMTNLVNELCDYLPTNLVPRLHFGTDEVSGPDEQPHPDLIPSVVAAARNRGREVMIWSPGIAPVDDDVITQLWTGAATPLANNPFVDSRANYVNHLDAFDGPIRTYFQQVGRVPSETTQALGGILCYWPDVNIDDPVHGLGIAPVFPAMVAYSERIWRGASTDHTAYWAKLPSAGDPLLEEFAAFEDDLLEHREKHFAGVLPFPYVRQTHVPWKLIGPFDHGGNLEQTFAPETSIDPMYDVGGQIYTWTDAVGGTVHLDHFFGFDSYYPSAGDGTVYAHTYVISDTERNVDFWFQCGTPSASGRRNGGNPPLGKWNAYGANVWVNGTAVPPPVWNNPGPLADSGKEIPFSNEGYFYREPTTVHLNAGTNSVLLRVPQGDASGYIDGKGKWMFSCMPIDWDGTQARELDGITFSAELPAIPPPVVEKSATNLTTSFEGHEIYNGSIYINGWSEVTTNDATETLIGTDLNRTHIGGGSAWLEGISSSRDGGTTTWDTGNHGDWTLETRVRFNVCTNGFVIWAGVGGHRAIVEIYADRTQDYKGEIFSQLHNNEDGAFHIFRIAHDSGNAKYHVWRDGERLTPLAGAPYDRVASDNRLIFGDSTSGSFGDGCNVDIDYICYDQTGAYLPTGADADADGMPDAWEYLHFGNVVSATPGEDIDGDRLTHQEEYIADTNPTDAASRLWISTFAETNPDIWSITVPETSTQRNYSLYASDELSFSNAWIAVPGQGPFLGNGSDLVFTNISGVSTSQFFQIEVSIP